MTDQVTQILTQAPAGFLPRVYYGIDRGAQTYRFIANNVFNLYVDGTPGDSFELYSSDETSSYIPAIAVKLNDNQIQIVIQGDYPDYTENFTIVNMKTGQSITATLPLNSIVLQDASYLGQFYPQDNKEKQITVLHDINTNIDNAVYASVDLNSDGVYNWITIGSYMNGLNGKSVYGITSATMSAVLAVATVGDLLLAGEAFTDSDGNTYAIGDLNQIDVLSPLELTAKGNIRGAQGDQGVPGNDGADGINGYTPYIQDGNWYINGVDTGVQAIGHDGTNGTNGQSFNMQSGLYSTIANWGQAGNEDPDGNPLLQLPTLPTTGITGKGYVVYDPLTTPLYPFYDLYFANDNDVSWTIIHPFSGIKGQDGNDGYTPYIQDGNWYINGVDTGVQATGNTGSPGATGPAGPKGVSFYGTLNAVSNISSISGSQVGDYIVNIYDGSSLLILGQSVLPGQVVRITSATTGTIVGNIRGAQGNTGATPNISVTATQLPSGSTPTATRSGTDSNPLITFGIPANASVETGTTSIGSYAKLPGGLLIQWGTATTDSSGHITITFPTGYAYSSAPTVQLTPQLPQTTATVWGARILDGSLSGSGFQGYLSYRTTNNNGLSSGGEVHWLAIGVQ